MLTSSRCHKHPHVQLYRCERCGAEWCWHCDQRECPTCALLDFTSGHYDPTADDRERQLEWEQSADREQEQNERARRGY